MKKQENKIVRQELTLEHLCNRLELYTKWKSENKGPTSLDRKIQETKDLMSKMVIEKYGKKMQKYYFFRH